MVINRYFSNANGVRIDFIMPEGMARVCSCKLYCIFAMDIASLAFMCTCKTYLSVPPFASTSRPSSGSAEHLPFPPLASLKPSFARLPT